MKRNVLIILMTSFMITGMNSVFGQEQPKPKKDTVNIDTDAKPSFYYAEEDEQTDNKSNSGMIIGVIAGVVVVAGAGFYLAKKKK
jgi:LPXTG-motif cell wall-anchored protein